MRILFVDTETTGLPAWQAPMDHASQPRLVQLALILRGHDGFERGRASVIVDPGIDIPARSTEVHGIDRELVAAVGIPERAAIGLFTRFAAVADCLVAHNTRFDEFVLRCAALRHVVPWRGMVTRCTMEAATPIVKIPPTPAMVAAGRGPFKSPSLVEAYRRLVSETIDENSLHDAWGDVHACLRIHDALVELGAWKEAA